MARLVEMPELQPNDHFDFCDRQGDVSMRRTTQDPDALMESILENINSTPIGRVLKRIGSLPEIRKGKVLNLRKQLTEGTYDVGDRLDVALDKVLENLTT